ncbi:NAD(P)-binding protein [Hypoxylon sp. FL1857]|nr:NAD(P)-binding protein [Hypoxylon sp. FL1857]
MTTKKIIAVVGATGKQGGSVARTFLQDTSLTSEWQVRAITRDPSSARAVELAKLGAEVVGASLGSVSDLERAFADATAVFIVTDFFSSTQDNATQARVKSEGIDLFVAAGETETSWAFNAAIAASRTPTLQRFVFSALPPVAQLSGGRLPLALPFDSKWAAVVRIEAELPDLWAKTSIILVGYYHSNVQPKYNAARGRAELEGPLGADAPLGFIDVDISTGAYVRALVVDEPAGIQLVAFDEFRSMSETVEMLARATGREVTYVEQTIEEVQAKHGPFGQILIQICTWFAEYGVFGEKVEGWKNKLTWPKDLRVKVPVRSLESWIAERTGLFEVDGVQA